MNLPAHHQRIFDILKGFDDGKTIDEIYKMIFPNDKGPDGKLDMRQWIQEVFDNRGWYEDRLLSVFPDVRKRLYSDAFVQ